MVTIDVQGVVDWKEKRVREKKNNGKMSVVMADIQERRKKKNRDLDGGIEGGL